MRAGQGNSSKGASREAGMYPSSPSLTLPERIAICRFEFYRLSNRWLATRHRIQVRRGTHGHTTR